MAEYIEREAAFDAITDIAGKTSTHSAYEAVWKSARTLKKIPTADVAPVVHGRWEEYTRSRYIGCDEYGDPRYVDGVVYYCSNPRCRRRTVIKERYCPSCGAKMDGGAIDD